MLGDGRERCSSGGKYLGKEFMHQKKRNSISSGSVFSQQRDHRKRIRENGLTTAEQVTHYTKAGGASATACRKSKPPGAAGPVKKEEKRRPAFTASERGAHVMLGASRSSSRRWKTRFARQ
jgi:hypothetical protein